MTENINLAAQLKKYFGFDTFKGNQEAIIRNLLAGKDTFVLMPTGGGKIVVLPVTLPINGGDGYRDISAYCSDEKSSRCDAQLQ